MNIYQQQILDHYKNPRNFGKPDSCDYEAQATNISCGDEVHVYLTGKENLQDMHFEGEGCSICLATASLLTEAFAGMSHQEILDFSEEDLMEILGIELTTSRRKCALLSLAAVKSALQT